MKAFLFIIGSFLILTSCHRKSVPENSGSTGNRSGSTSGTNSSSNTNTETKKTPSAVYGKPLIVVDGKGSLVTNTQTLLANGAKSGFPATSARAFTPQERANLIARFKTVPPRVLHVPDRYVKKTAQGEYYVLKDKFWYWKKADGFFYLDDNYYK
jgi:hypothetical protein